MLASHGPEVDSRWTPKYEILKLLLLVYLLLMLILFTIYIHEYLWKSIGSPIRDSVTPALRKIHAQRLIFQSKQNPIFEAFSNAGVTLFPVDTQILAFRSFGNFLTCRQRFPEVSRN